MPMEQVHKQKKSEKFRLLLDMHGNVMIPRDKHDNPDYGAVMRHFRVFVKEWSATYLAIRYTEVLKGQSEEEDEAVTARWIQLMEKENQVPKNPKRRWILAMLLGIPASSFGLQEMNQPPKSLTQTMHHLLQRERIDLAEYQFTLETYHASYRLGQSSEIIQDVYQPIDALRKEIHLTASPQKEAMIRLLCEYYTIAAGAAMDCLYFEEAIGLLDQVVFIAKENNLYLHLAYALRQRGIVYSVRGQATDLVHGFEVAKPDFDAAVSSFEQIREFETHLSAYMKGVISDAAGPVYARTMLNDKERTQALKEVDKAVAEIGKQDDDISCATVLDEERCYIDRADIYLASPMKALRCTQMAREQELAKASKLTQPAFKVRHAQNAFLIAKSYFVADEYAMATTYAEMAIPLVEGTAPVDFAHLNALYQALLKSPFGKDDAIAELGIALLKAQQPQLFNT